MQKSEFERRVLIKDTPQKVGEEVEIFGWIVTIRTHGKIAFLDLRDGTGVVQVTITGENVTKVSELAPQDVVKIVGSVTKREERYVNKDIPTGEVEIHTSEIKVMEKAETLPFDMGGKDLNLELPTLLDYRSLTLRHSSVYQIFKVQAQIAKAFREVAEELGCTEIFVPTIVASATEGGADVFKVDYYGHKAYLAQSPQLYKQMLVPIFERVYTIAHAYRAEPSVTTRHLSESTQIDCEFGFVEFEGLLDLVEKIGVHLVKSVEENCKSELKQYGVTDFALGKIPRLKVSEVQEIIYKETGRDSRGEKDLAPQDEFDIWQWSLKTHKSDFVTVTHFPTKSKPFYTMPDPQEPELSLSYDLLFRGSEVLSGSQRINNYNQLLNSIKSRGMDPDSFTLYLQAFKYGMPKEGGLSFGLERLTWKILGLQNIRQASLYPRDMERVDERFSLVSKHQKKD